MHKHTPFFFYISRIFLKITYLAYDENLRNRKHILLALLKLEK